MEIIVVVATASPLIAKAREIGPTVPPSGIATLPPKVTRNLARHCVLEIPRNVTKPLPSRWTIEQFPQITVSVKITF